MFLGCYPSILTSKNQLTLPGKFVVDIGTQLLVTAWFENSLIVLPFNMGNQVLKSIMQDVSPLLPEERDLERFFFANAQKITLDGKNRFVLPTRLKEYAKIGRKAVFLGVSERVEIWDEQIYKNYSSMRELQIREVALQHYKRLKQ